MIDLRINKEGLKHNIEKAKENHIIIPTIAQMQNPDLIPEKIKEKLTHTGLWDVDPVNLFRISWHNEAKEFGGLYQHTPNYVEIPSSLSGVPCRILAMSGKWFPTGCHKVGASFGCLAPRLVTGQFDATYHHAVWPSTGNYCRGGAFNSKLLACDSVAILPQDMSKERFDWLKSIAGQIIATPGCESNVKEIFDKTWELKKDPSMMIFNQFAEMGNPLWHYNVTGYALADLFEAVKKPGQRLAGACFTSGSAGTMSSGDLLKERYPGMKLAVGEALQCPTILDNGFGGHRIEGIGDKHIPWVHNVKNTDMAIAIDDEDSQRLLRLFNCKEGQEYLKSLGMTDEQHAAWLETAVARARAGSRAAQRAGILSEAELQRLRTAAQADLTERVTRLAARMGVDFAGITIRAQRTRWGSCSARGSLSFNCLLMLAPPEVREYVAVHELCHRKQMNHSAAFWREVASCLPDYAAQRAWLREHGPALLGRLPET